MEHLGGLATVAAEYWQAITSRVDRLLADLALEQVATANPFTLSGGGL